MKIQRVTFIEISKKKNFFFCFSRVIDSKELPFYTDSVHHKSEPEA